MDVHSLNVPADFAAIFEKQAVAGSAPRSVDAPVSAEVAVKGEIDRCAKCSSKLSAVEAKMGRCLTCGTSLGADGGFKVGL